MGFCSAGIARLQLGHVEAIKLLFEYGGDDCVNTADEQKYVCAREVQQVYNKQRPGRCRCPY
jgi:hypothetical protein